MLRLLRQISLPQLGASWGRTSLVAGGIATGVTLIAAINIINTSVLANFRRTIELMAGPAALEVTLGVGEIGFAESTIEAVSADSGVAAAVPLVRGTVALADDPSETLQLFGADLIAEDALGRYQIMTTTDRREIVRSLEDPRSILLTTEFARRHHLPVGAEVRLATASGIDDFTVRGLLEVDGLAAAFGGQLAVMDLAAAQRALAKPERIDQIDIVVRPDTDVETLRQRLESTLPPMLSVTRPAQRAAEYDKVLASFQAMLTGLSLLCLVAGVFVIYNTTSTGAVHRALTMAALRLIGADESQLFRLLMVEALCLGIIGVALGALMGIVLAHLLLRMVTDSMGVIFQIRFPVEALAVDPRQQVAIGALGIAVALFASFFAARQASVLQPLEAIRTTPRAPAAIQPTRGLVFWWLILVLTTGAALVAEVRLKSIMWGNLGSTLWFASTVVIAIPLVRRLARRLSATLPRFFGGEGRVAAESLFRAVTRTGITVGAIALVLSIGITVASVASSFRASVDSYFSAGPFQGDLVVSAVATEGGWLETPISEQVGEEIRQIPGVLRTELLRGVFGQMYRGVRIAVVGISDEAGERYPQAWYREGDAVSAGRALRADAGVIVTDNLADRFDLHVGHPMEVDTPTGPLILPIVGVVQDFSSATGTVGLNRRLLAQRWQDPRVSRVYAFLEPTASLEAVRDRIAEGVGSRYRLKILSMRDLLAYQRGMINRAFAFTDAMHLLIIVVTMAGIFDLLLSSVFERRRELALWRMIGADDATVRRSVLLESATIGILGALLGVGVGIVTARIWVGVNFRYLLGYYLQLHFALGSTVGYIVLVLLMTMVAGYGAARQATSQPVLQDIQAD